jgi:hypothetical protein
MPCTWQNAGVPVSVVDLPNTVTVADPAAKLVAPVMVVLLGSTSAANDSHD